MSNFTPAERSAQASGQLRNGDVGTTENSSRWAAPRRGEPQQGLGRLMLAPEQAEAAFAEEGLDCKGCFSTEPIFVLNYLGFCRTCVEDDDTEDTGGWLI